MSIPKEHFPATTEQAAAWRPIVRLHALARTVLCVANTRIEGAWCAYCYNVPGIRHASEVAGVLGHGCKLREDIALVIFPEFTGTPYAE